MLATVGNVTDIYAKAEDPLGSMEVAVLLKTPWIKQVVSVLTCLVQDETLERSPGGKYQLKAPRRYDAPLSTSQGTRRTLLSTNTQEIAAGERRKEVARKKKQKARRLFNNV